MAKQGTVEITVEMAIDVDGAPKSYGPNDHDALDYELNAHVGAKANKPVVGYLVDDHGKPIVQGPNDPAPGFYISTTGYVDHNNGNLHDPRRYVDASQINYTLLARVAAQKNVETGDICVVHSIEKGKTVFAIVGDTGNSSGKEGSLALLQRLGYKIENGKSVPEGEDPTGIVVRYFAGSNPAKVFFFSQEDVDGFAKGLDLDANFSMYH